MSNKDITQKFLSILPSVPIIVIAFFINPILGAVVLVLALNKKSRNPNLVSKILSIFEEFNKPNPDKKVEIKELDSGNTNDEIDEAKDTTVLIKSNIYTLPIINTSKPIKLEKRKKYLHIALNNTLEEAINIISQLPTSDKILIEVGTPLIKIYGVSAITEIKSMAPSGSYIIADNKCADLATREVKMMAEAGANAATCLGVAPIETIDTFISECQRYNIDSIIDMMNVENPLLTLKQLKTVPNVVMLHRGVDESNFSKDKQIPLYQIKQIKGNYNIIVAVAGGDTIKEVQRAIFNDADIVVVWKNFYQNNDDTTKLAKDFLIEI